MMAAGMKVGLLKSEGKTLVNSTQLHTTWRRASLTQTRKTSATSSSLTELITYKVLIKLWDKLASPQSPLIFFTYHPDIQIAMKTSGFFKKPEACCLA